MGGVVVLLFIINLLGGASIGCKAVENESNAPAPSAATKPATRPAAPGPSLEIQSFKCTSEAFGGSGGYAYVEGEVKNISDEPLKDVEAVGSWYTDSGQFVRSDNALLQFNPVLPGQTSPFKTLSAYNPAMTKCRLDFQSLFGAIIPSTAVAGAAQ